MTTRQALRTVAAEEAAEDFASGTEFSGSDAMALVDNDFKEFVPLDPKGLVTRWRDHLQSALDALSAGKAEAEKRIAETESQHKSVIEQCEQTIAMANLSRTTALAAVEADLAQLAACREAIDLAVGRLNKA